jgi:hypothetical protein
LQETGVTAEIVVHLGKDWVKVLLSSEKTVEVFTDTEVVRIVFHAQDRGRSQRP